MELLTSKSYVQLLVLAALIGIPVSAVAYFYLALVGQGSRPGSTPPSRTELGFAGTPVWWPVPCCWWPPCWSPHRSPTCPATSGHEPAEGFKAGGSPLPLDLLGIVLASLATLSLGVVLGPEAPLIAIGGGLGVLAVRLAAKDAPPMAATVMAAAGSFAAVSTLLGSPILGAFLLDGGLRHRWSAARARARARAPGRRRRHADLRRPRQPHRARHVLAGHSRSPTFSHPTGMLFLWALAIGVLASRRRHRHPAGGLAASRWC